MRGSIVKRSKTSWSLVIDHGRDASGKRKQKWHRFEVPRNLSARDAHKQAEAKLAELLHQIDKGTYVDATKTTMIAWLRTWLESVKATRRPATYRVYASIVDNHIAKSPIASRPLQKVRPSDLDTYYGSLTGMASSSLIHHAVLSKALSVAVRDGLLLSNPAARVEARPKPTRDTDDVRQHCWSVVEAQAFLKAAREAGSQAGAFYALALDSGARLSELLGLTWDRLDLDAAKVTIARQLAGLGKDGEPLFGPTKTGKTRSVTLGTETVALLAQHRREQRELMMRNRVTYKDYGLVFAKEDAELFTKDGALGQPVRALIRRSFHALTRVAKVRPIRFHGLRHTCATLLLTDGTPVTVVSKRLGHSKASMTLDVYGHVLEDGQQNAAVALGSLLFGGSRTANG